MESGFAHQLFWWWNSGKRFFQTYAIHFFPSPVQEKYAENLRLKNHTFFPAAISGVYIAPYYIQMFLVPAEVCHEWKGLKFFSMLYKRWGQAPHIRLAGGVYKPLHGAVIKSYGIERWRKGIIKVSGDCKRAERKWTVRLRLERN